MARDQDEANRDNDEAPMLRGISALLRRAAEDDSFQRLLTADPEQAARIAGIPLTERERVVLRSVPAGQLATTMASLSKHELARRAFLESTAASAVTALGGAALAAWQTGCKREERRPSNREGATGGHAPDWPGGMGKPESQRKSEPPVPQPRPHCSIPVVVGPFRTLSGPERSPGQANLEGLQDALESSCKSLGLSDAGMLVYEFTVEPQGAVTNIVAVKNTGVKPEFELVARRQLERLVFFELHDPSRVTTTIELKRK